MTKKLSLVRFLVGREVQDPLQPDGLHAGRLAFGAAYDLQFDGDAGVVWITAGGRTIGGPLANVASMTVAGETVLPSAVDSSTTPYAVPPATKKGRKNV